MIQNHPNTHLSSLPALKAGEKVFLCGLLGHTFVEIGEYFLIVYIGAVSGPAAGLYVAVVDTPVVKLSLYHRAAHVQWNVKLT